MQLQFPFLVWRNSTQLFGSLGHEVYHCGRQRCAVQCLQLLMALTRSWRCWACFPGEGALGASRACPENSCSKIWNSCFAGWATGYWGESDNLGWQEPFVSPWDVGIPLCSNAVPCYPMAVQGLCTHGKGGGSSWLLLLSVDLACSLGYLGKGVTRPWDVWWGLWSVVRVLLMNGVCSKQRTGPVKMISTDSQRGFLWCLTPKGWNTLFNWKDPLFTLVYFFFRTSNIVGNRKPLKRKPCEWEKTE